MILVDANVLLRLIQVGHPHQQPAVDAIALLYSRDRERLAVCPQVLYEMYAVCTRPADGPHPGLGLAPAAAMAQVETAQHQFDLEPEPSAVLSRWKELVVRYGVRGKATHDARLAGSNGGARHSRALNLQRCPFRSLRRDHCVEPLRRARRSASLMHRF
jgi:predicted nucleic acid-binding protein